ncbi:MAG TPA: hypothetical protein VMA37_06570 [Acetobacteraceae bacterium]|nr:hypothetical protein [Acetobacteraceae bacterium]
MPSAKPKPSPEEEEALSRAIRAKLTAEEAAKAKASEDALRALGAKPGDRNTYIAAVMALQHRAFAAGDAAWNRSRSHGLARDMRSVRSRVAALLRIPDLAGGAKVQDATLLLLDAEERWAKVKATPLHPMDQMAANGAASVLTLTPISAEQVIARIEAKGVKLGLGEGGEIVCLRASALGEHDRALIREHAEAIKEVLGVVEVLA